MGNNTKEKFAVSVVIPVYNAELYLKQSVNSALDQNEVKEVLLVDDGSMDKSLDVCKSLAETNSRVKYLTHKDNKNLGPAATRNLGIKQATQPFIAFLDADDFYLPHRFAIAKALFNTDPSIEGVYEAIGAHFESDEAKQRWRQMGTADLTSIKAGIDPETLFFEQSPIGQAGHCHLNGLTVKSKIFQKIGYFDVELRGPEDTAFFIKLSAIAKLMPGEVKTPVAMRRVHTSNTYTHFKKQSKNWRIRLSVWITILRWPSYNMLDISKKNIIISKILWDAHGLISSNLSTSRHLFTALFRYAIVIIKFPKLLLNKAFLYGIPKHLKRLI